MHWQYSICQLNRIQQSKHNVNNCLLVIRCFAAYCVWLLLLAYYFGAGFVVCRSMYDFIRFWFCLRVLEFICVCVCVSDADLAMIILLLCIWFFGQSTTCIFVCGFRKTGIIAISHTYFVF